ncbi:hypothetical protein HPB47_022669, partial [Ixodes persulcatus]
MNETAHFPVLSARLLCPGSRGSTTSMPRSPSCLRTLCAMRGVTLDVAAVVKRFVSNTAPVKLQAYRRELHRRKVVVCDVSPLSGHSQQLCSESSRAALTEPHRRVTSLVMGSSCSTGTLLPAIVASPGEGPAWGAAVSRWSTAIDRGSQVCEMPTLTVDPDTTNRGPSNWSKIYPKAAGEKQSPIDIVQKNVQSDPFLAENPLRWNYKGLHCTNLLNTGCGWRADVTAQGPNISGGPLHHNYQMVQFHSHWGTCSKMGSEHTVDGEHYAGE